MTGGDMTRARAIAGAVLACAVCLPVLPHGQEAKIGSDPALLKRMQAERDNVELQAAVQPFKAFDNLYYVGNGYVSSWIVTTSGGLVLIDVPQEPFVIQTID